MASDLEVFQALCWAKSRVPIPQRVEMFDYRQHWWALEPREVNGLEEPQRLLFRTKEKAVVQRRKVVFALMLFKLGTAWDRAAHISDFTLCRHSFQLARHARTRAGRYKPTR